MANNRVKWLLWLGLLVGFSSCSGDCEPRMAACTDSPPTDEACLAHFNRWFYDAQQHSCYQAFYSGCSQKGFATQAECEACLCP